MNTNFQLYPQVRNPKSTQPAPTSERFFFSETEFIRVLSYQDVDLRVRIFGLLAASLVFSVMSAVVVLVS